MQNASNNTIQSVKSINFAKGLNTSYMLSLSHHLRQVRLKASRRYMDDQAAAFLFHRALSNATQILESFRPFKHNSGSPSTPKPPHSPPCSPHYPPQYSQAAPPYSPLSLPTIPFHLSSSPPSLPSPTDSLARYAPRQTSADSSSPDLHHSALRRPPFLAHRNLLDSPKVCGGVSGEQSLEGRVLWFGLRNR